MKIFIVIFILFATNTCFAQKADTSKAIHTKKYDVRNGYQRIYDSQRRLVMQGTFKGGKLINGKKYTYGKDGLIIRVEIFKDGVYVEDGLLK